MFQQMNVKVIGVIENMSVFIPPDQPHKSYQLFGSGGGEKLANESTVPLLAKIPMEMSTQEAGNEGKPIVISKPESSTAKHFIALANLIIKNLSRKK